MVTSLVELPGPRERLRRLVRGAQLPQAVLRIGRGFPVPATPRRPLAEVVGPAAASTGAAVGRAFARDRAQRGSGTTEAR